MQRSNFVKILKKFLLLSLAITLTCGLGACKDKNNNTDSEKITLVLDWTPNTNHTGIYVAAEKGYFTDAGIEVEVVQPPEGGAEMLVGSGKAQFGISVQDGLAPAFAGENALPVTAVAALVQHNTSGIISRKGEGMNTAKGLERHKYATWDSPVEKATIKQVMEAQGGDFSKVELIPSTVTDEVSALRNKSVDAIWVFYGWAGIACRVAGVETDYFHFADIDEVFDYYTPLLIANNKYLEENPETVRAFLSALSKGYEYAVENPDDAADILMKYAPELKSNPELIYESQKYLSAQYVAECDRWGEFDPERWAGFYKWLNTLDILEEPIDPYKGFTNDYLPYE
ncbi:MAG: ABC transporter substrate-binding protein [Ruminococcaceae bacterium]|nr:ABC transporter substrate-binding protein [Oscillospiraceae bacterium]